MQEASKRCRLQEVYINSSPFIAAPLNPLIHFRRPAHDGVVAAATMMKSGFRKLSSGNYDLVSTDRKLTVLKRCNAGTGSSISYARSISSKQSTHSSCKDDDHPALAQHVRQGVTGTSSDMFTVFSDISLSKGTGNRELSSRGCKEEDDQFTELGPVRRAGLAIPKLMTEKPETFPKANGRGKVPSSMSSSSKRSLRKIFSPVCSNLSPVVGHKHESCINNSSKNRANRNDSHFSDANTVNNKDAICEVGLSLLRSAVSTIDKISDGKGKYSSNTSSFKNSPRKDLSQIFSSHSPVILPKHESCSTISSNNRDKSNSCFREANSVKIENGTSVVKLSQLRSEISTLGEISDTSLRSLSGSSGLCHMELQSAKSSRKAVAVGQNQEQDAVLPVQPLQFRQTVAVRISNVNPNTADSVVHGICMSYGSIEELARIKENVVDVLFLVEDKSDTKNVLKKLSNTIMDDCKWSVKLQSTESASEVATESDYDEPERLESLNALIACLRRRIESSKIDVEDLQYLCHTLQHLENHPITSTK